METKIISIKKLIWIAYQITQDTLSLSLTYNVSETMRINCNFKSIGKQIKSLSVSIKLAHTWMQLSRQPQEAS